MTLSLIDSVTPRDTAHVGDWLYCSDKRVVQGAWVCAGRWARCAEHACAHCPHAARFAKEAKLVQVEPTGAEKLRVAGAPGMPKRQALTGNVREQKNKQATAQRKR